MDIINIGFILQLFVLLNPLSSFSVLLSAYKQSYNIKLVAIEATVIAFLLAVAIIFLGPILFSLYGISIDSFRIAGGIILLLLGIETVREAEEKEEKNANQVDSFTSIIATPLLTGPAVISFLTIKIYELSPLVVLLNSFISFFLVGLIFFAFATYVNKVNIKIISILSKVLGLFLTAVAIEMIAKGISALFSLQKI
ncbi:MAG: MarC family protein [Candidatus Anstonellaceae archaeon]